MYRKYSVKYGFQIPRSVEIGGGLALPHFGGIVINSGSVIGRNCNILQGVTLGNTKRGGKKGAPVIGDDVYIGPNAVIVGNVKVGNNVLIAPNAYVNIDVPDNTIVLGNPAVLKYSSKATAGYLNNTVNLKNSF
jgi:serine O-acetyltransferase